MLRSVEALEPILDGWRALAELRGNAFITPEWFLAAIEHLEPGGEPVVVAVHGEDGVLLGVLPFVYERASRTLRFAGAGAGDRFHPAADLRDENLVAAAAAPALDRRGLGWRRLALDGVDVSADWWRTLTSALPSRSASVARPPAAYPYIPLAGRSWDQYLAGRSRQLRSQLGRKGRGLAKQHQVVFRQTRVRDEVDADLSSLFALHAARWQSRGRASSMADRSLPAFHSAFAAAALERGWLRLYVMEVDGAAAAAWYGWRLGDRWSYFQAGFDPAWSRQSVGFLLLAETIKDASEEQAAEYDLLLGDEPFKARFAEAERWGQTVVVVPAVHPIRLAAAAGSVARRLWRRLPSRLRERALSLRARREGRPHAS